MNPYKAAIKLVQELFEIENPGEGRSARATRDLVLAELESTYEWISAEENGLTPQQIKNASDFPLEGGASGRRTCDACSQPADVHMLVTQYTSQQTAEVYACKAHMLDPGPLLDY